MPAHANPVEVVTNTTKHEFRNAVATAVLAAGLLLILLSYIFHIVSTFMLCSCTPSAKPLTRSLPPTCHVRHAMLSPLHHLSCQPATFRNSPRIAALRLSFRMPTAAPWHPHAEPKTTPFARQFAAQFCSFAQKRCFPSRPSAFRTFRLVVLCAGYRSVKSQDETALT